MKRIIDLMKEHNIGLISVNDILRILEIGDVRVNSQISDKDYYFLSTLLKSEEVQELNKLNNLINRVKQQIRHTKPCYKLPCDDFSSIRKQHFYNIIINKYRNSAFVKYLQLNHSYDEQSYTALYKWCIEHNIMDIKNIIDAIHEFNESEFETTHYEENENNKRVAIQECPDYETAIMRALRGGHGDIYGF